MIIFRSCPRCEGDLYVERGLDDTELVCLQCGRRSPVAAVSPYAVRVDARDFQASAAR